MKDQVGFQEVLQKVVEAWNGQRQRFLESAKDILPRLKEFTDEGLKGAGGEPEEALEIELLEEAYQQFMKLYDLNNGGFGRMLLYPGIFRITLTVASSAEVSGAGEARVLDTTRHLSVNSRRHRRGARMQ